jgi:hypothetical protein
MQSSSHSSTKTTKPITKLNNQELHENTLKAASDEKSATLKLLEYLAEVDSRRLHAIMGYPSLWQYVHKELGYSESQTSERVSAMRLMIRLPEVREEIEANQLSLTAVAKLATHIRRERVDEIHALQLLDSIIGKPTREVERILASESSEPIKKEMIKPLSAETTRILIDVDQDFLNLLTRVRELKGHPGSSTRELLRSAMKELVKRAEPRTQTTVGSKTEISTKDHPLPLQATDLSASIHPANASTVKTLTIKPDSAATTHPPISLVLNVVKPDPLIDTPSSRKIPAATRHSIRMRSGDQCEYVDPSSGRRCECKTSLEFDHIIPFALGGDHSPENIRHFCRTHNQLAAIQFFGMDHMRPFLKN